MRCIFQALSLTPSLVGGVCLRFVLADWLLELMTYCLTFGKGILRPIRGPDIWKLRPGSAFRRGSALRLVEASRLGQKNSQTKTETESTLAKRTYVLHSPHLKMTIILSFNCQHDYLYCYFYFLT